MAEAPVSRRAATVTLGSEEEAQRLVTVCQSESIVDMLGGGIDSLTNGVVQVAIDGTLHMMWFRHVVNN